MRNFIDVSSFEVDEETKSNVDTNNNSLKNRNNIVLSNVHTDKCITTELKPTLKGNGGLIILDTINNAIGALDNIIESFNYVRIEKQKTKQIESMTKAYIVGKREETKQIRIREKEETIRLKEQLYYDYKKYKASLFEIAKKFELENNKLNESSKRFNANIDILRQTIINQLNEIKRYDNLIFDKFNNGEVIEEQLLNFNQSLKDTLNSILDKLIQL